MEQKDKDLLLRYFCAILPYRVKGIKVYHKERIVELDGILPRCEPNPNFYPNAEPFIELQFSDLDCGLIDQFKPYLRPMSSMTDKEEDEYIYLKLEERAGRFLVPSCNTLDWLNAHHFDYLELIDKGFALVAPDGMYS